MVEIAGTFRELYQILSPPRGIHTPRMGNVSARESQYLENLNKVGNSSINGLL